MNSKTRRFDIFNPEAKAHELIKLFENLGFLVDVTHYRFSQETFEQIERLRKHWYFDNKELTKQMEARLLVGHNFSIGPRSNFAPRGGATTVQLIKDGRAYIGNAHCFIMDNFSRTRGIKEALRRASAAEEDGVYTTL